jgi:hypothetical protein
MLAVLIACHRGDSPTPSLDAMTRRWASDTGLSLAALPVDGGSDSARVLVVIHNGGSHRGLANDLALFDVALFDSLGHAVPRKDGFVVDGLPPKFVLPHQGFFGLILNLHCTEPLLDRTPFTTTNPPSAETDWCMWQFNPGPGTYRVVVRYEDSSIRLQSDTIQVVIRR